MNFLENSMGRPKTLHQDPKVLDSRTLFNPNSTSFLHVFSILPGTLCNGGHPNFRCFFLTIHNDETMNLKISRLWRNHWLFSIILGNRIPKFWILEHFSTQIRLVFTWICFALVSGAHFGSLFHHLAVKEEEKINENQTTDLFWWISWSAEKNSELKCFDSVLTASLLNWLG